MDILERNKCYKLVRVLAKLGIPIDDFVYTNMIYEDGWIKGMEEEFQGFQASRNARSDE